MSRRTVFAIFALTSLLVAQLAAGTASASVAAATITVTTTNDTVAGGDGCSLREAITAANTNATVNECVHNGASGTDQINFAIGGAGAHTITASASALPTITSALIIDGYSQSGAAANNNASSSTATILIVLSGSGGPAGENGLTFNTAACTSASPHCMVRGLSIQRFKGDGIKLNNTNNVDIFGNYIGTAGTTDLGNGNGVHVVSGDANRIGAQAVGNATRNVISGNDGNGILIEASGSVGNAIEANLIGVTNAGNTPLANGNGVKVVAAQGTTIGGAVGTTPGGSCTGTCNVISGNSDDGIELTGETTSAGTILGNYVGLDSTGEAFTPNNGNGVLLDRASNLNIGSSTPAGRNLISDNIGNGISIYDLSAGSVASDNVVIKGNFIGMDTDGNQGQGNHANGISVRSGAGVTIGGNSGTTPGGSCTGDCNLISTNFDDGVFLAGTSTGGVVKGNFVGVDVTGTLDKGNANDGVAVNGPSGNNTIGGTTAAARNVISGNGVDGVELSGSSGPANTVTGNYIGTDTTGAADLGNTQTGVHISNSPNNVIGSPTGVTLGGNCTGGCNLISGNNTIGVFIEGATSTGNHVSANMIGLDVGGALDRGNTNAGVFINAASGNTVGGTLLGERNVISGNNSYGVEISSSSSTDNVVEANFIGTDTTGTVDLGNLSQGVAIINAPSNTVGGTSGTTPGGACTGACNLISGNNMDGVLVSGNSVNPALSNAILGNLIGTNAAGTAKLANTSAGISITGARKTIIGGSVSAARNVISGNGGMGISLSLGANGTEIYKNYIGTNTSGGAALANTSAGVGISATSSVKVGASGKGNRIAYNGADGVFVVNGGGTANKNAIRYNSIFSNVSLGIDLDNNNVTGNDGAGDADSGANGLQNYPVLLSAVSSTKTIGGSLTSAVSTQFTIDFYKSASCDVTGFGEGGTHLGSTVVTTNSSGLVSFSWAVGGAFSSGDRITATATSNSSTSEFSACFTATTN